MKEELVGVEVNVEEEDVVPGSGWRKQMSGNPAPSLGWLKAPSLEWLVATLLLRGDWGVDDYGWGERMRGEFVGVEVYVE